MFLYRIGPERFLQIYTGTHGSYEYGARWNLPGDPVIYFGTSPSVAMLEIGNYIPSPRLIPGSYRLAQYEVDDQFIETISPSDIPPDWNKFPHPFSTQVVGSAWLQDKSNIVLLVPSSAVPGGLENMAIFNPLHPDAGKIKFIKSFDKIYDERLFSKT
jgi:RES domain-containing protein